MAAGRSDSRRGGRAGEGRKKRSFKGWLKLISAYTFCLIAVGWLVGYGVWISALQQAEGLMPSIESKLQEMDVKPSRIVSADGVTLYTFNATHSDPIKDIAEVPIIVRKAMVAAEDRRFYEHNGVDFWALGRVAFLGARDGRFSQGGSTLTMQLAKRLHSAGEKTIKRKLMDMAIASKMEDDLTKDQILVDYLNSAYFGSGANGIKDAARTYFNKSLNNLTLGEAAMLARCVRRPRDENPFKDYDKAKRNRDVVLQTMLEDHAISEDDFEKAKDENDKKHLNAYHPDRLGKPTSAPYAVMAAIEELRRDYPSIHLSDGGITVKLTIDSQVQKAAETSVRDTINEHRKQGVNSGAFVLMDPEGRILAEVGGVDFNKSEYNRVRSAHLQPGSSFKPFVYATAFYQGKLEVNSVVSNEAVHYVDPSTGRAWEPGNDGYHSGGRIPLVTAVASSINYPAVHTILDVGVANVVTLAHDVFGFQSDLPEFPSLALGSCQVTPLEMAQAYSVFMLRGSRATPFLIDRVENEDGSLAGETSPHVLRDLINPGVCDDINTLLRAVVERGTGTAARVIPDARGKTGTTSSNKDAWFCGFANGMVGVGWVGNERYDKKQKKFYQLPMSHSVFGGTVTVQMWTAVQQAAQARFGSRYADQIGNPASEPEHRHPTNVVQVVDTPKTVDPGTGSTGVQVDPMGSQDQQNPPVPTGDPGRVVDGPGHGADPTPTPAPPPPPDPTLANPGDNGTPAVAPRRHTRRSHADDGEYVDVLICADSGDLANEYCPETVTRRFKKGQEPKHRCRIHHG